MIDGRILMSIFGRDDMPLPGHIARRRHCFGGGSVLDRQRRSMMTIANKPTVLPHAALAGFEPLRDALPTAARAYGQLATLGEALHLATVADLLIRDSLAAARRRMSEDAGGWRAGGHGPMKRTPGIPAMRATSAS